MSGKKIILIAIAFFSLMAAFSAVIIISASGDNANNRPMVKTMNNTKLQQVTVNVKGMTCEDCEKTITILTGKKAGVHSVKASFKTQSAVVEYDETQISVKKIMDSVAATGYTVLGYTDETGKHTLDAKKSEKQENLHEMKCGSGKCGSSMKVDKP